MQYTKRTLKKLIDAAEALGVITVDLPGVSFTRSRAAPFLGVPMVYLGTKGPASLQVVVFAHEYGHIVTHVKKEAPPIAWTQRDIKRQTLSAKQKTALYEEELRAWRYGFRFMRQQRIEVTKFAYDVKRAMLRRRRKELRL